MCFVHLQVQGSGGGVAGSFKDTPLREWLVKHNQSQRDFQRAEDNFTSKGDSKPVFVYSLFS